MILVKPLPITPPPPPHSIIYIHLILLVHQEESALTMTCESESMKPTATTKTLFRTQIHGSYNGFVLVDTKGNYRSRALVI